MSLFISKATVIKEWASPKFRFCGREHPTALRGTLTGGGEGRGVDGAAIKATNEIGCDGPVIRSGFQETRSQKHFFCVGSCLGVT